MKIFFCSIHNSRKKGLLRIRNMWYYRKKAHILGGGNLSQVLHFSASTSVKNLFGQGLVTDQVAAVFELVKNSYDADARNVYLEFQNLTTDSPSLIIKDDGTGMDLFDIEKRWMVIGTDSKKKELFSPIFKRPLNGDKGIGRFSVDRLGSYLHLETQKKGSIDKFIIDFDWTLFEGESKNIGDIDILYTKKKSIQLSSGVKLVISELRDKWDQDRLRNLYKSLRQFKSPFKEDDNFKIFITAKEYDYNHKEVTVETLEGVSSLWIGAEIRPENPEVIYVSVNKDGLDYEETYNNTYSFGSIKAKVFFFNQGDKIRFSNRYSLRVREYGNIRLYRDNFRVYPYGEENNDWLDIDRRKAQGFARFFGSRDLIGYVQITKEHNKNLKPLTNRQGLEDNVEFQQLRDFVVEICIKTLEQYYFEKFKKNLNETIKKTKAEIGGAVAALNQIALNIREDSPEVSRQIKEYTSTIEKQQKSQIEYVQEQKELVKVYSRIAQKETFLHKLIHQSMIHVNDAHAALENYISEHNAISRTAEAQINIVKQCVEDALSLLRTVRDDVVKKRTKSVQDINLLVRKYFHDNSALFSGSHVNVSIQSAGRIEYIIDPGDVKAIINNLSTNAVKSLRNINDRDRTLKVEIYKTDKYVIIKFTDNGIGIKESERERIFDPFHSTTEGFGLGLTIIDEITKEYNGALELIDTGIGACFSVKLRCR